MADEVDVEVVVWRRYLVAAKQVHRRAWFWLLLGLVLMTLLAAALWCHRPRCNDVEAPFPVVEQHHPHLPPPVIVVVPTPVVAPPVAAPVRAPVRVLHVLHRVHHVAHRHHHCG